MALRSGYKGYKKLTEGLKEFWPGILGADIPALKKTFLDWSSYAVTGAVNELKNKATSTGIFTVNADKTVTVNGSHVNDTTFDINSAITIDHPVKLVGCPSGGSGSTYQLVAKIGTSYLVDYGNGVELEPGTYRIYVLVKGGYTASNVVFKPMFTVNHNATYADYVPYTMTNNDLTAFLSNNFGKVLTSSDDLNNLKTTGIYGIFTAPTNSPIAPSSNPEEYAGLLVFNSGTSAITQVVFRATGSRANMYIRFFNGSWLPWMTFTGTAPS